MGPLHGLRVIEMSGIGPAPFCGMLLADMGAELIRIGRKSGGGHTELAHTILHRGRPLLALDLKAPKAVELVLRLVERADALIEGFRPGVMERLNLGPDRCLERNERLVYGRMTGWGQTGPLSAAAGHDINYIAISGALHAIGSAERPFVPLNLVGDFGGGGMLLAFGVACALIEAQRSGKGQVVDAAMTDGAALLMAMTYSLRAGGFWKDERRANLLDGGAPFYDVYRCADGNWIAIGAIEPQFYALLLEKCEIREPELAPPLDHAQWPRARERFKSVFAAKTREEWCRLLEGTDVCFAPVLGLDEAPLHPHNRARGTFIDVEGIAQPAPAPRFSRTSPDRPGTPKHHSDARELLETWGLRGDDLEGYC